MHEFIIVYEGIFVLYKKSVKSDFKGLSDNSESPFL